MVQILAPTEHNIADLARALRAGELVAFPTETVYGLGADATNESAIKKVYSVKGRPSINPLIAHYTSLEEAEKDVIFNDVARALAQAFWPGPMTLVLPRQPYCRIHAAATAGLATVAVRVPAHDIARKFLQAAGVPVVAPSANPSGHLSPVRAEHIARHLGGKISWILQGEQATQGLESTIIDATGALPRILRYGTLTQEMIEEVVKLADAHTTSELPQAPGMLLKHYAPRCPLRLTTDNPQPGEALLAFGAQNIPTGFDLVMNLSTTGDLHEASRNLFDFLHQLEERGVTGIAVMPVPDVGAGKALNDKLRRAAAGSVQ